MKTVTRDREGQKDPVQEDISIVNLIHTQHKST